MKKCLILKRKTINIILVSINKKGCFVPRNLRFGKDGYTKDRSHRKIYASINGRIPKGIVIRHSCDNPSCLNPCHLLSGNHSDNVADRVERQRSARGIKNGRAKLTRKQVAYIRKDRDSRISELARKFRVSRRLIKMVKENLVWKYPNRKSIVSVP